MTSFPWRFLFLLSLLLTPLFCTSGKADERPNIVFLISDDHDYDHFGWMGHPVAQTPTIDDLARTGAVFTTAHLPMSRCHPTLASMLSGRYPHQSGIYYNFGTEPLDETNALPLLLKQAGYLTYCEGKYWEGDPRRMGFTHGQGKTADTFVRKGQEKLFEFLDNVGDKPFFVWWAPKLPHTPHNPSNERLARFEPKKFPVPDYVAPDQRELFLEKEHKSYAMEAWLDDGVAELRAALEERGLAEKTMFVFLIDNGWCNGLVSKGSPREKGVRTPVIFQWPGKIKAEQKFDGLISTLDVTPTILDYAGVEVPQTYAGRSLRPMIEGEQDLGRDALYGAIYPAFATKSDQRPERDLYALYVRTPKWKYVYYLQDVVQKRNGDYFRIQSICTDYPTHDKGDEELFDLSADPHELHNLAGDEEHRERLDQFKKQVLAWWKETGGRPLELP